MSSSPSILITGGAGFIGSALVRACLARGDRVVVLDNLTYAGHRDNLAGLDCTLVVGDVADAPTIAALFAAHRFDAIIHAAAESHVDNSITGAAPFIRTNITGTHLLLEAVLAQWQAQGKPAAMRYVQVSTDEVYGALGEEGMFTRASTLQPNSPYAASKAAADLLVRAWHQTHGLPTITTRCCNNYGPYQHPEKLIPHMLTQAVAQQPLPVYGDGMQSREWIHVDDHARGVLAALDRGVPGETYLLGSGEEWKNLTLVESICDLLAQKHPGHDYRALIAHVADRPGHDYRYALDTVESHAALGFTPRIAFAQGMEQTVQWYLDHPEWVETMRQWRGR